jgi:hypothetical protein
MPKIDEIDINEAFLASLTAAGVNGVVAAPDLIPAFVSDDTMVRVLDLGPGYWRYQSSYCGIPFMTVEVSRKDDGFSIEVNFEQVWP